MHLKTFTLKLFILLNFVGIMAMAQSQPSPGNINTLIGKIGTYNDAMPIEKLYLHFDKPYYSIGDTIWFKGYLMNQAIGYSRQSNRLYVELVNDSNAVVKRFVFPVGYGITWGNIALSGLYVHEGAYTIRAYTNWMRNFGDDYFFKQTFYINNEGYDTWLVNLKPTIATVGGKDNVKVAMQFNSLDGQTPGLRTLQMKVLNGKKVLFRNAAQTATDGSLDVDFSLPSQTILKNLSIVAQDKLDPKRTAVIPVKVNRPQDVDLQFMPESGQLIAGLPTRVGFKAIGEDGKGVDLQGSVFDSDNIEVARLNAFKYGMGTFDITPQEGKTYTAKVTMANGEQKSVALPALAASGIVLRVKNNRAADSIIVNVYTSSNLAAQSNKYNLIGMARNVVCYGAAFTLASNSFRVTIAKSLFPTGVAHLMLINANNQPVNERLTYIDHHDNLKIDVKSEAAAYVSRDSIPVHVNVVDENGKPVRGSFSMAVTDDSQVKQDEYADNISSRMLLSADLKGYVEDPAYYLQPTDEAWRALDALLLTQGWVGYDLKKVDQPIKPAFEAEKNFEVKGTVTNLFNKPIAKSDVLLMATGKQHFIRDTITNAEGKFVFANMPPVDSVTYVLSARNAKGKTVNGGVSVDDQSHLTVKSINPVSPQPWNVNTDSTMLNYVRSNKKYQVELDKAQYGTTGKVLNAVNIHDRASIRGSQNLNGAGNSDQVITESDLINAGKASLMDVISSKVKGFRTGFFKDSTKQTNLTFFINDKRVHFVFDGVDVDRFYEPTTGIPNEKYEFHKQYLDYISAEDVLGIEVLYSSRANALYNEANLTTDDLLAATATGPVGSDYAYLEITTRAGSGPNLQRATSIYLYRPVPLTLPKMFYTPRYPVKGAPHTYADLRSTIHWAPSFVTDKDGNATVSFYAADKAAKYSIIIQGSNMSGKVGCQTGKITVGPGTK
ncbi:hypothetical protein ACFGVR_04920 [Mucilaginibacter sp. AW1-3]